MEKTEKLSNHRHMHGNPRRFEEKKAIDLEKMNELICKEGIYKGYQH